MSDPATSEEDADVLRLLQAATRAPDDPDVDLARLLMSDGITATELLVALLADKRRTKDRAQP